MRSWIVIVLLLALNASQFAIAADIGCHAASAATAAQGSIDSANPRDDAAAHEDCPFCLNGVVLAVMPHGSVVPLPAMLPIRRVGPPAAPAPCELIDRIDEPPRVARP